MKPKKNPSKDPSKNSFLFFSIALTSLLWIALYLLDFPFQLSQNNLVSKTKDIDTFDFYEPDVEKFVIESQQVTQHRPFVENYQITTDPEPIDPQPDNDLPFNPEPLISPVDPKPSNQINFVEKDSDQTDFILAAVESPPIFPGCEKVKKEEQKKCFEEQIRKFVAKNTNYPETAKMNNQSGKIFIEFMIDNKEDVKILNVSESYPLLQKEAKRVISRLPKMTPGRQNDKAVNVKYVMPITFK